MVASRAAGGTRTRTALLLGLLCFCVYNANLREVSSQDTIPARILPVALIEARTFTLDMFFRDVPAGAPLPYWVQRAHGHYVSGYPLLPALLALPIYFLPVRLLGGGSWVLLNVLAKLSASLIAALSVVAVYLAAVRLERERVALAVALVYGLGTATWSISSQGLWAHGPAALFLAVAIAGLLHADRHPALLELTGVAAGLMLAARPATLFGAGALLALVLHRDRRRGGRALVLCAATVAPFALYNLRTFGSLEGGYARMHADFRADGWAGTWQTPLAEGLAGVLLSPSRGLFVYSPVLLLALLGLARGLRGSRDRALFGALAAGVAGEVLLVAKYSVWFGGASFGPRLLTEVVPAMALWLAPAWAWLEARPGRRALAAALFAASVGVQAIGAFYYPSPRAVDWNTAPRDVPVTVRVWDWKDTQLARLLANGPRPLGFGGFE